MDDISCKEACLAAACWVRLAEKRLEAVKVLLEQTIQAIGKCPRIDNDKSDRQGDQGS